MEAMTERPDRFDRTDALGAGFLAGVEFGVWTDLTEATSTVHPRRIVELRRQLDRAAWTAARNRALGTIPELSALEF